MIIIELVDGCNLKCTLCPNRFREQTREQMSLATLEKVLMKYPKQWKDFFNWGEPLLHKEFATIADMVLGRAVRVSTNLSVLLDDEQVRALCKFRVILISFSGMTKETYQLYHRGGNFDLVKSNLERLMVQRRKHRMPMHKSTIINWLQHRDNEHEYEEAKKYIEGFGARFYPQRLVCTVEEQLEKLNHPYLISPRLQSTRRQECRIMDWDTIGVDGSYLLCCSSQNVKIGYTIDDDISHEEIVRAKMNIPMCQECRSKEYWRMYS